MKAGGDDFESGSKTSFFVVTVLMESAARREKEVRWWGYM